jgi:hypothetical protein
VEIEEDRIAGVLSGQPVRTPDRAQRPLAGHPRQSCDWTEFGIFRSSGYNGANDAGCRRSNMRIVIIALAVSVSAAMPAAKAAASGPAGLESSPELRLPIGVEVASNKVYKFINPFPFPIDIKIYGNGPGFPQVARVPAPPAPYVPVPYPSTTMEIKIKKPGGTWSGKFTIKWKSGPIALPFF